jgi:type VI secretion system protein ImpF
MALEPEVSVQRPLLDRLVDLDPRTPGEQALTRAQAVRALKDALRRDLEWLLNARRTPIEIPRPLEEVRKSVFNYGLPDISSMSIHSQADETYLLELIERTIALFEPRLADVKVVAREAYSKFDRTLHFHVEAMLLVDPAPESISFDTVFQVDQGACEVKG